MPDTQRLTGVELDHIRLNWTSSKSYVSWGDPARIGKYFIPEGPGCTYGPLSIFGARTDHNLKRATVLFTSANGFRIVRYIGLPSVVFPSRPVWNIAGYNGQDECMIRASTMNYRRFIIQEVCTPDDSYMYPHVQFHCILNLENDPAKREELIIKSFDIPDSIDESNDEGSENTFHEAQSVQKMLDDGLVTTQTMLFDVNKMIVNDNSHDDGYPPIRDLIDQYIGVGELPMTHVLNKSGGPVFQILSKGKSLAISSLTRIINDMRPMWFQYTGWKYDPNVGICRHAAQPRGLYYSKQVGCPRGASHKADTPAENEDYQSASHKAHTPAENEDYQESQDYSLFSGPDMFRATRAEWNKNTKHRAMAYFTGITGIKNVH